MSPKSALKGNQDLFVRLQRVPLFSEVPQQNLSALFQGAKQVTLPTGTAVVECASPADCLYLVLEGHVGCYSQEPTDTVHGKKGVKAQQLVGFVGPNGFIGLPEIFLARAHKYGYRTFGETRLVSIPSWSVLEALKTDWALLKMLLGEMSQRIHGLVHQIDSLKTQRAEQRLAAHFLDLLEREGGQKFILPYGKKDLAAHLGLAPESLSRALKRLKSQGVEVDGRTITVTAPQALLACLDGPRSLI